MVKLASVPACINDEAKYLSLFLNASDGVARTTTLLQ